MVKAAVAQCAPAGGRLKGRRTMKSPQVRRTAPFVLVAAALSLAPAGTYAQGPPPAGRGPANAKAAAPLDINGQGVSVGTEDWRYRLVTSAKGGYASVP